MANPRTSRPALVLPALLALLLLTFVAFAPALTGPQLFDDFADIDNNPSITSLAPSVALHPPRDIAVAGRPFANYTFALNYAFNAALGIDQRPDPNGAGKTISYHFVALVLHLFTGLVLFGILRRTFDVVLSGEQRERLSSELALVITALWMLHPLQTAVVDYIMARTDGLATLCYFATLYCSIRAWDAASTLRRNAWFVAGVVICFLGMGSKEFVASVPLMTVLYDRVFRVTSWRELLAPSLRSRRWFYGGLAATLLFLAALIASAPHGGSYYTSANAPWHLYLVSQGHALAHYLWLVVWPAGLTFDYGPLPIPFVRTIPGWLVVAALVAGTAVAWRRLPRWGWLAFCGTLYFALLAPASSIVPLAEITSDRRMYGPLAALLVVVVIGVLRLAARGQGEGVVSMPTAARLRLLRAGAVAMVLLLAGFTFRRSMLYRDPEAMWRDTLAKLPTNARAMNNLASIIANGPNRHSGEIDALYRQAMLADSNYADPPYNLALGEMERGNFSGAEALLKRVVAVAPYNGDALILLSNLQLRRRDGAAAVRLLEPVADSMPDPKLLLNLGLAYLGTRQPEKAEASLRLALEKDPMRPDVLRSLGMLLTQRGRGKEAVPLLERLVAAEPFRGINQAMVAGAYAGAGRRKEAVEAAGFAVAASDADATVFGFAGHAMVQADRPDLAEQYLLRAVQLGAMDVQTLVALGDVESRRGKPAEAAKAFRRALQVDPAAAEAQAGLDRLAAGRPLHP